MPLPMMGPDYVNCYILEDGQGGLLEVLFFNNQVFVSYSENLKKGYSSTSVASAKFNENFSHLWTNPYSRTVAHSIFRYSMEM